MDFVTEPSFVPKNKRGHVHDAFVYFALILALLMFRFSNVRNVCYSQIMYIFNTSDDSDVPVLYICICGIYFYKNVKHIFLYLCGIFVYILVSKNLAIELFDVYKIL